MPTFQEARDGLDALLKDGKGNLSPDDRDKALENAARTFSRRFPLKVATPIDGDNGFEYDLPSTYIDGFSTISDVIKPWDVDNQDPPRLERKDWRLFDGPSGLKFRFTRETSSVGDQFLLVYTVPHTVAAAGIADVIGVLDAAGSVIAGTDIVSAATIATDKARDIQLFIHITSAPGTRLDIIIQTSEDNVKWADIGAFDELDSVGDSVIPLKPEKVSKFIRLIYTTTGSFTLEANLLQEQSGVGFTIPDHSLDAFLYLATAIASQSLADFYSNLVDSQLAGETTDYEGKATFWHTNHDKWEVKWKTESDKIQKQRGALAFGQGEWDLVGSTKYRMLTHEERFR